MTEEKTYLVRPVEGRRFTIRAELLEVALDARLMILRTAGRIVAVLPAEHVRAIAEQDGTGDAD